MAARESTLIFNMLVRGNAEAGLARVGTEAEATSRKVGAVGKALGALILVDVGYHMAKSAAEFQKATNVYVTAAGETTKNLGLVRKGILDVASSTGAPIKGLTDGMYTIEKAGYRGAEGLKILKAAAQGAAEENANLGTVTNAMTSIMASYHLSADQSVSVMNQLKTAAGESKANMEQFAGSLSTVLPIASANHVAFADVAGALATLTQHGTSADEATQELSNTIRNLAAPNQVANKEFAQLTGTTQRLQDVLAQKGLTGTLDYLSQTVISKMGPSGKVLLSTFNNSKIAASDAQTEFAALGPEAQKLAKSFEDGSVGIGEYRKAAKGLGGEQSALALQFLTTYTNAHGFQDLIKQGGPAAQTYTEAIKKMTGGANGLNVTLQTTGENLAGTEERTRKIADAAKDAGKDVDGWASTQKLASTQLAILKERVGVLGITIGTGLLPFLTGAVKVLGGMVGFIQGNATVFKDLAIAIGAVAIPIFAVTKAIAAYAAVTRGIAALSAVWSSISSAMVAASAAGEGLRLSLAALGTATVIGAVVVGAALLATKLFSADAAMKQVKQSSKDLGQALLESGGDVRRTGQAYTDSFSHILTSMDLGSKGESALAYLRRYNVNLEDLFNTAKAGGPAAAAKMRELEQAILNDGKVSPKTRTALLAMNDALIQTAAGGRQNADALRAAGQKTTDAAHATNDFNDALQGTLNLKAGYQGALLQFKSDLFGLGDAIKKGTTDLSDNTSAGVQNQQAFLRIAQDIGNVINQYPHLNDGSEASRKEMKNLTDQVFQAAQKFGFTHAQVQQLLDKLGLTPPAAKAAADGMNQPWSTPGLDGTYSKIQALILSLGDLTHKYGHVSLGMQVTGEVGPGTTRRASGGWVWGPGTATSDSIPARLSTGEFVVNAASAAKHSSLLEAINGRSGGTARGFATGGPVTGGASAALQVNAGRPDSKQFDDLFKAPVAAQKRNQAGIDKAVKSAFVDPQANALDRSRKGANIFADAMPKEFVKRIDSHRGDILKTQTATFFDTANATLNRTGLAAHVFADGMPKDFAKTVTSHTGDIATSYKVAAGDPWAKTTSDMNDLADRTGKSVPAKIVSGFNNAVGAVKAAADQLLALIQKPIDLLHGKTIQIVANTSISGVVTAATGGHIRGPGTSTSDSIPAMLSDGEFVVNAAATKKHLPLLHQLNKAQHFADGGLVTPDFKLTGAAPKMAASLDKMMLIATDKLSKEAQKRVDEFYATVFAASGGGDGESWPLILQYARKSGIPIGNPSGGQTTGGQHAVGSFHYLGEALDIGSSSTGNLRGVFNWFARVAGSLEELFYDPAGRFVKRGKWYPGAIGGHTDHVHVAASLAAMEGLLGIKHAASGVKQWDGIILRALQMNGLSPALLGKVERQMQSESGGNRTIQQQVRDANSGPNHAQGLMQVIPTTFRANHVPGTSNDILDPLANVAAALHYARGRYGPGLAGLGEGHGYANGGMPSLGRPFWVGERGPELMKLGAGGATVVSSERSHRMAGGSTTLMHVENQYVGRDVDLQRELARAEFVRQTANGFG